MRFALWVCMVVLCSSAFAQERNGSRPFLRRATLVAACAASYLDYWTTAEGARLGAREGNGWFADSQGRPRLGLMFGVKTAMCGMSVLVQEGKLPGFRRSGVSDPVWIAINSALAARFTVVGVRNLAVIDTLRRQASPSAGSLIAAR